MPARKTIAALLAACMAGVLMGVVSTYSVLTSRDLRIQSFSVDSQEVLIGDKVTFSWNTSAATQVAFRFVHLPTGSDGDLWEWVYPDVSAGNLPPTGQWSYSVPPDLADKAFKFEIEAADQAGNKVAKRSDVIRVKYWPCFTGTAECATPAIQMLAMFQAFEHGYMLWREDTATVYALAEQPTADPPYFMIGWRAFPDTWAADQTFSLADQIQAGLQEPHGRFSKIMAEYPDLLTQLGWATDPEIQFEATIQQTRIVCGASCSPSLLIRLYDGRVLQLAASYADLQQGYIWQFMPAA